MELVKKNKEYSIFKKTSGRYGVAKGKGQWINGDEKVKILVAEKLVKIEKAKPKAEPASEEETKPEEAPAEKPKE